MTTGRADWTTWTVAVLSGLAPLFVALHLWGPGLLRDLTVEDGPVEYLTALVFLAAAVCFAAAGFTGRARAVWVLPLALVCFFVAGEEVSWGQRLLGVDTPAALESVNVQGETNLHNIEGVHGIVRAVAVLVLLAVFGALPLLAERWRLGRAVNARLRLPVPPLVALVLVLVGVAFMAVPRLLAGSNSFALDEVGEIYVAAAWLLYALRTALAPEAAQQPTAAAARARVPHRR